LLEVPLEKRVTELMKEYRHFIENPETLIEHLQALHRFHGSKQLEHWTSLIQAGDFAAFVSELLALHYDPSYFRATSRHYVHLDKAQHIPLNDLSQNTLKEIAAKISRE
jgi:tRNA 2-selenouridine synthase